MVDGLGEDRRETARAVGVQERRVDDAGLRHHLDGRVVLCAGADTDAQRRLRAPRGAAVPGGGERDERRRTVARARLRLSVAGGQQVDERRLPVGRHGGLPIVGRRVQQCRAGPAGGRVGGRRRPAGELPVRPGLSERVEPLGGQVAFLLPLLRSGPRLAAAVRLHLGVRRFPSRRGAAVGVRHHQGQHRPEREQGMACLHERGTTIRTNATAAAGAGQRPRRASATPTTQSAPPAAASHAGRSPSGRHAAGARSAQGERPGREAERGRDGAATYAG